MDRTHGQVAAQASEYEDDSLHLMGAGAASVVGMLAPEFAPALVPIVEGVFDGIQHIMSKPTPQMQRKAKLRIDSNMGFAPNIARQAK